MNQKLNTFTHIQSYRHSKLKSILYYFLCIISFGFMCILNEWSTTIWSIVRVSKCRIEESEYFLIVSEDGQKCIVESMRLYMEGQTFIGFVYHLYRFIYKNGAFTQVVFHISYNKEAHNYNYYQNEQQIQDAWVRFSLNSTELPRRNIFIILIDELMHPLFVFQLFQILLWIYEEYISYSLILLATSIISMLDTVYEYNKNQAHLHDISKLDSQDFITVRRLGITQNILKTVLIPGDIIQIQNYTKMPCDAILIKGQCIMNEYNLNGESNPITKYPLSNDDQIFQSNKCINSILYSTTQCLKAEGECFAFVIATGFDTQRGQMIREIKFTSDYSFDFYEDSIRYLKYLSIIAIVGYLIALPFKIQFLQKYPQISKLDLITDILDLVAVCVPPTLPTTLQIGLNIALNRFKKKEIFCNDPHRINLSGCVSQVCFDKTGTLTEDQLNLFGLIESIDGLFQDCKSVEQIFNDKLIGVLGCCHKIFKVENKLVGHQLDLVLFNNSSALIQDDQSISIFNKNYKIIRINDFSQELQRMSVIVQDENMQKFVFVKGQAEKLKDICLMNSIPLDYDQIIKYYSHQGFQVLGCGYKQIYEIEDRINSEQDIIFLGFIIIQNKLKQMSSEVIKQLKDAEISTILVTGDNVLTSVRVAKQCGIIEYDERLLYAELVENGNNQPSIRWRDFDVQVNLINEQMSVGSIDKLKPQSFANLESVNQLDLINAQVDNNFDLEQCEPLFQNHAISVTGRVFLYLLKLANQSGNYQILNKLIAKTKVYAKMKKEHKHILISYLKQSSCVAFCGNSSSDMQAFRAADIGISLTQLQVSIAASFTSSKHDVSSVPLIIIEGRGALTTSFYSFEYMTLCSLVQFISCTILYFQYSYMTNSQFLVIDLFVVLPLSILMNYTSNKDSLTKNIPQHSLISFEVLAIVIGQSIIQLIFQLIVYLTLLRQSWYVEPIVLSDYNYGDAGFQQSYEATSLFLVSNFQYSALSICLANDLRFKKPFYKNKPFLYYLILLVVFEIYLLLFTYNDDTNDDSFDLTFKVVTEKKNYEMARSWLVFLTIMIILNTMATYIFQTKGLSILTKLIKKKKQINL